MEGALFLNVVVRKSATVLQLFAGKNQALLIGRNALLILNLLLNVLNRVGGISVKGDSFAGERLYENLHAHSFKRKVCVIYSLFIFYGISILKRVHFTENSSFFIGIFI